VEASLLDAMIAQSPMNDWWQEEGISYIKKGDAGAMDRFGHTRLITGMFECADGQFLQFHTGGPGGFKAAMDVLGFGDRVQAVQGAEMRVPLSEDEYRIARVEVFEAFKGKPRDEWIRLLHAADVAALPVLHPAEVLLDDQVEFVGQRIALPDADFGTIYQSAPAVIYKASPCAHPAPARRWAPTTPNCPN
jgi:crotonobetainyl-CoA:carnitine CoA-transferase CaiB-like acyl-CoA transferase